MNSPVIVKPSSSLESDQARVERQQRRDSSIIGASSHKQGSSSTLSERYTIQQIRQWSEARVFQWLQENGFAKYEDTFRENMVNGEALVELDYALLKELSIRTVGERVRLNVAIKRLREQGMQFNTTIDTDENSTVLVSSSALHNGYELAASDMVYGSGGSSSGDGLLTAIPLSAVLSSQQDSRPGAPSDLPSFSRNSLSSTAITTHRNSHDSRDNKSGNSPGLVGMQHSSERASGANTSSMQRANTDLRGLSSSSYDQKTNNNNNTHHKSKTARENGSSSLAPVKSLFSTTQAALKPLQSSSMKSKKSKQGQQLAPSVNTTNPQQSSSIQPMSAPLPRLKALTSSNRQNPGFGSPLSGNGSNAHQPQKILKNAIETSRNSNQYNYSTYANTTNNVAAAFANRRGVNNTSGKGRRDNDELERLGFQFREMFGTDISVTNLADSLSVKALNFTISGPENQVKQVPISNARSAQAILDRVRKEFDLNSDVDGDQYSLFSMTSVNGGARCLGGEELVKIFTSPDMARNERFFLRKRHNVPRPYSNVSRTEHLQRAIERLGGSNMPSSSSADHQQQQQQQKQPDNSNHGASNQKWESTNEKLTKVLGERPPSELVSMNVEKYFPGNEARARHSIMRKWRRESQGSMQSGESVPVPSLPPSRRGSKASSRKRMSIGSTKRNDTNSPESRRRTIHSKNRQSTLTIDTSKAEMIRRQSEFPSTLEPIEEGLPSPGNSAVVPKTGGSTTFNLDKLEPATPTSKRDKRMSKIYANSPIIARMPQPRTPARNVSYESLEFSDVDDDEGNSDDSLSDLSSSSSMSDSFCSDDSFYKSLADSDIDADQNLAAADEDSYSQEVLPVLGKTSIAADMPRMIEQGSDQDAAETTTAEATAAGTFGASSEALPDKAVKPSNKAIVVVSAGEKRRSSSGGRGGGSKSYTKKRTWIKGAPIASGSFGSVYYGMSTRTGAIMAVKEVDLPEPGSVSTSRSQRMVDALRHELDLLKGLDHKNVVKYLGTDMDEKNIYIFLEYVSGGSVSSALASFGMFPESLVRTYTAQILEGLVYLHGQGIIHRDIKGGNVLIDQDGSVKISDFGISKRVDEVVAASKTDRRASLQGSVFWMAPEVVKDTRYTIKGDVWSLGCLMIEMITGTHPFPDLDQMQALYLIGQKGRPEMPEDVSSAGLDFLEQALQVDLDQRPTAVDLLVHGFVTDQLPSSP